MIKAITNARLVLPSGLQEGTLLVEDGQILAAGSVIPPRDAEIIDAKGRIVGPGFIDIHCHGGGTAHGHENPAEAAASSSEVRHDILVAGHWPTA